jgi:undecaprenyl-diphosphatase
MNILHAIIYGIIQGLGEFLPISSTAHLTLAPWLFKWNDDPGLTFDVALHLGTLIAVLLYFWRDWVKLITAGVTTPKSKDGNLFWFLVVATIPGALFGKLFESKAETTFRNPALIAVMLIVAGCALYLADKYGKKNIGIEKIGLRRSILIGISQAIALIPGVSRSGATIMTGLGTGLSRESAAKFSFLLSAPIIFGSVILKYHDILHPKVGNLPFFVAILTAAIVGLLSIKFLLKYLKYNGFGIFVIYRLALGTIVILIYLIR